MSKRNVSTKLRHSKSNQLGVYVSKGEHGELVIFWQVEGADEADRDTANIEGSEIGRQRLLVRFYRVWNLEQCALPQAVRDKLPTIETHQHDAIEAAEKIIAGMPNRPGIRYEGSKAYYNSDTDPSREELVAEMGAAFLCAEAGISPVVLENQAAYVQGWLG